MGRVTRADQLPEWFDTRNYEGAARLRAREWLEQLRARAFCFNQLWQWQGESPEILHQFLTDPVDWLGIGLSVADVLSGLREQPIAWAARPKYQAFIRSLDSQKTAPGPQSQDDPTYPGIRMVREGGMKVDFYLPDELLIDSFKRYLAFARKKSEVLTEQKWVRANTFALWCDSGLLQYMDLATWAFEAGSEITNKVFAHAIFPKNPEKGEENIRKTTRPQANSFLDSGIEVSLRFATLRAYAEWEELQHSSKDTS